jgi:hypothetical protein
MKIARSSWAIFFGAILDFTEHVIISSAGSAALLAGGAGWESATAFGVAGVFIDLDHFLDFWRETRDYLNLPRFMGYFSKQGPKKLVLFMHSWEAVGLFLGWAFFSGAPAWLLWAGLGWLQHLLLDDRFNRLHPWAYSFLYRASHGFAAKKIYG